MFCSPWDCRWNAPVPPFVFRLADGQLRKKSPPLPMRSTKSRSEPKTRANMPSLRQLEFAFQITPVAGIDVPGRGGTLQGTGVTDPGYKVTGRAVDLEATARDLLRSLGAKRIALE